MSLTVSELVARPHLRLELMVAGDLKRVIRWVHSSDMPDPSPYLRGDEVVLTAGIWYWHGTAPSAFAASLIRANAAALGFGLNPLVAEVPDELVRACRAGNLTLFRVPPDVAFIAIAEEFVEAQRQLRERVLLDSLERSSRFLYSLQAGCGLDDLLRVLAGLLPKPTAVIQRGRGIIAETWGQAPPVAVLEAAETVIAAGASSTRHGELVAFSVPVAARDAALVLAVGEGELTTEQHAIIDQALAFIAIELQHERAVSEAERRFVGELFDLLAAGEAHLPVAAARLRSLGLDPEGSLCAVSCAAADLEASLAAMRSHLRARGAEAALAIKGVELVAIVQVRADEDLTLLAQQLHAAVGPGAFVGVGGPADGVRGLRRSMIEASHARRFAARRRDAGYATHGTLASHALLIGLQEEELLDPFFTTLIRPLEEHDARRHTDLVRTLELFLGSGGRYQETADALHVHVNTLRLRLARIETLTGRSLDSMDDRVDFWIALRARNPASDSS